MKPAHKYERQQMKLKADASGTFVSVYSVFRNGLPVGVEAPGFLVPPQRQRVIEVAQRRGWLLELGEWSPIENKRQHPTQWLALVTGRWPLPGTICTDYK